MSFRDEKAAETLQAVLDALAAPETRLDEATRRQWEALIRLHGPRIATASAFTAAGQVTALLDALWALGDRLPAAAGAAMRAGQADPRAATLRGLPTLSASVLKTLCERLRKIVDFRVFEDPQALIEAITREVSAHEDRLERDELTGWQALQATCGHFATLEDADAWLHQVETLLGCYPRVHALLEGGKRYQRKALPTAFRGSGDRGTEERQYADILTAKGISPAGTSSSAAVERYGNVYFPGQVLLTQPWIPLIVHIAQQFSEGAIVKAEAARLTVALGDLTLRLNADDFKIEEVIGGQPLAGLPLMDMRVVTVEPARDSEPVVFFLTPQSVGPKRISIEVFQGSRRAATLAFATEVVEPGGLTRPGRADFKRLGFTCATDDTPQADLELHVRLLGDQRTLVYEIRSPDRDGLMFQPAGQKRLAVEPAKVLEPIFERLSEQAGLDREQRTPEDMAAAIRDLKEIGTNLYSQLFSDELKTLYVEELRPGQPGEKSLLIMSDEPWIPWEMVRGFGVDAAGQRFVDPPFCEKFRLARWLVGPFAPPQVVTEAGVLVAPPSNLQAAEAEQRYFLEKVHRFRWGTDLSGLLTTVAQVEQAFEAGEKRLYHFSCHGNINTDDPDESKLELEGGYLRPSQITAEVELGLNQARPMVFLNACHAGRGGIGLTKLGGWAERFVGAGASAFIGAQWEIRDTLAVSFIEAFYDRLWGLGDFEGQPMPLGQAFREARLAIKACDEANPTWLAYVLYGDPQGQVHLGK